tara:strand:- start:104 stop:304 length:201 start_codon:yes stop_codon:yes gene_type:complete
MKNAESFELIEIEIYGKKDEERCKWCGALIFMQPGQSHREDGNTYCNTQCAYDDRLSKQPVDKQLQ